MEGFIGFVCGIATCFIASEVCDAWDTAVERAAQQIEVARRTAEWEAEKLEDR